MPEGTEICMYQVMTACKRNRQRAAALNNMEGFNAAALLLY